MTKRTTRVFIAWLLLTSRNTQGNLQRTNVRVTEDISPQTTWKTQSSTEFVEEETGSRWSELCCQDSLTSSTASVGRLIDLNMGLLSKSDYDRISYYLSLVSAPTAVIGIVTNIITIMVFLRCKNGSVTTTFFSLACCLNIWFLLTALPFLVLRLALGEDSEQNEFYLTYGVYVCNYVNNTLRKVIICQTMLMSVDRFLVVAFPLRVRAFTHHRRPKLYVFLVGIAAFLLDVNVVFKVQIMESKGDNNITLPYIVPTDVYVRDTQIFFDLSLASSFIFRYFPLTITVTFNTLLGITLAKYSKRMSAVFDRTEGNTQSKNGADEMLGGSINSKLPPVLGQQAAEPLPIRPCIWESQHRFATAGATFLQPEKRISVTVTVYSFIFTLLALPNTAYPLLRKLIPEFAPFQKQHYLVLTLEIMYGLLDNVSAAMNFFVYFLIGSSFKKGVFRLFGRGRKRQA